MLNTTFHTITLLHNLIFHHYLIILIHPFGIVLLSFMKEVEWTDCRDGFYIKLDSNYSRFLGQAEKIALSVVLW